MTNASNLEALADGGIVRQAIRLCIIDSISITESPDGWTEYGFGDGSACRVSDGAVTDVTSPKFEFDGEVYGADELLRDNAHDAEVCAFLNVASLGESQFGVTRVQ